MSGKTPLKAADELFSKQVRKIGMCFAAGVDFPCSGYLQCCHIISRRYRAIRWNPRNAVAMCQAHHVWYTHHPLEWRDAIDVEWPGRWEELRWMALNDTPEKPKDALERLKREAA